MYMTTSEEITFTAAKKLVNDDQDEAVMLKNRSRTLCIRAYKDSNL